MCQAMAAKHFLCVCFNTSLRNTMIVDAYIIAVIGSLYWLWRWALDSTVAGSIPGRRDKYWDGWPSSDGQTTSVFHQATQAISSSYPQRDVREMSTSQSAATLCGWAKGSYGPIHLRINVWVEGNTVRSSLTPGTLQVSSVSSDQRVDATTSWVGQ